MKISELIIKLQEIQEQYGDLDCLNLFNDKIYIEIDKDVIKFK